MSHSSSGREDGFATSVVYDAVSRESLEEVLEILDDLSASRGRGRELTSFINFTDPQNEHSAALHLAAKQLNAEILSLLLLHGANPNIQDVKGYTPVLSVLSHLRDTCQCEDCRRKAVKCIDLLGEHKADMNLHDKSGELRPLYMAAELGLQGCAAALLNHGADATATGGGTGRAGSCPPTKTKSLMAVLLERVPEVVLTIFDRAIQTSTGPGQLHCERSFELTFDMSAIMPPQITYSSDKENENGNIAHDQENGKNTSSSSKLRSKIRPRREMGFLSELLDSSMKKDVHVYNSILQHPMVHLFADIKWNRLKFIYLMYMLMQANFLIWYTIFLILVIYVDCHLKKVADTVSMPPVTDGDGNTTTTIHTIEAPLGLGPIQIVDPFSCHITLTTKLVACYVLFLTLASCMKEMMHLVMDFRNYVYDIVNYIQIIGIGAALATVVIVLNPIAIKILHVTLYPLASFGIGVCWLQLFLMVGRLPEFAMYLEMLSRVTFNFAMSLAMYSFILIAFATSYCMLFPTESKLSDFPWALVRVMTSMAGELNFETLFEDTRKIINPWVALTWYMCLLILVAMVLMNLLVGLAVSDIQGCKRNAEVVVIQRRIRYLDYLEKSFFLGTMFVPNFVRDFLRKRIAIVVPSDAQIMNWLTRSNSASAGLKVTIRPNDPRSGTRLTSSTKMAIRSWMKRTKTQRSHHRTGEEPTCESAHVHTHGKSVPVQVDRVKRFQSQTHKEPGVPAAAAVGDSRRMRHMEYKMQQLETRLIELDVKLDRYFDRILFIKESNEYEQ